MVINLIEEEDMTRYGIKLAKEEGVKNEYKTIKAMAQDLGFKLLFFEDEEINGEFKFFTAELLKYKELEFMSYSFNIYEVIREVEDFLKGKEE